MASYEQLVKNLFLKASDFSTDALGRWQDVRSKAEGNTLTADDLASNAVAIWCKALDAWFDFIPFFDEHVLPTIFKTTGATGLANNNLKLGHVKLTQQLAPQPSFKVTTLFQLGGNATIPGATATEQGDGLDVKVTFGASDPATGVYHGVVYEDTRHEMVATIVVFLT